MSRDKTNAGNAVTVDEYEMVGTRASNCIIQSPVLAKPDVILGNVKQAAPRNKGLL
jgi:hypothetical protein